MPTAADRRPGLAEKPRHQEVEGIKDKGGGHDQPSLRRHPRLRTIRLGNSQPGLSGHGAWDGTHDCTEQIRGADLKHWLCTNTLERAKHLSAPLKTRAHAETPTLDGSIARARTDWRRTWGDMSSCHAPHATTCDPLLDRMRDPRAARCDSPSPSHVGSPPFDHGLQPGRKYIVSRASVEGVDFTIRPRRCESAGAASVRHLV